MFSVRRESLAIFLNPITFTEALYSGYYSMTQPSSQVSRRRFLGIAAAVAATPMVLPSHVLGRQGATPPSEKLITAFIGMGSRGEQVIGDFYGNRHKDFLVTAVCDCYDEPCKRAKANIDGRNGNSDCKMFKRYEDVLDSKEFDVVAVTTPDHWHTKITVEACKAGKDVFCEKPLTLTPFESRQIVAAARKYNRVCTSGSQRVMEDYGYMAPIVQSGAIGEVKEAFFDVGGPPEELYYPEEPIPAGMDWDRWLGPAPWVPYNRERCSGDYGGGWRRCIDYGNGMFADWGAHKLGGLLYVLGLDTKEPLEILPPNCEANPHRRLTFVYENGVRLHHSQGQGHDITLVGSGREFRHSENPRRGDRAVVKPLGPVDVRRYHGDANRLSEDFAFCVRNRCRPFQDLAYGANTALACQLANITYRLNRPLKWDAATTSFIGDEQANRFVDRPKRSPYTIND